MKAITLAALVVLSVSQSVQAQTGAMPTKRPIPYPVFEPTAFTRAVERGTRTRTGAPGPKYWTQWANYRIAATLDTAAKTVSGQQTVRYFNRSPDTLRSMVVFLNQNVYRGSSLKNRVLPVTNGVTLGRVALRGQELQRTMNPRQQPVGYTVDGTVMRLLPRAPILPGDSVDVEMSWSYPVPPTGSPRNGTDTTTYMIAYWYPQIAVYDDVIGWFTDPYLTNAEFYNGYADYDVSVTVPNGFVVAGTGSLDNASSVLSAESQRRLERARTSDQRVVIVGEADRGAGKATAAGTNGTNTWRFKAQNVRDFAWAASGAYLWDAARAQNGTLVQAFYRPELHAWSNEIRYLQHSVDFLSKLLWPYEYPQMSAVDGPESCGGMEYPMMTCLGGIGNDTIALYGVTVHETGHMWFPMMVGSNERRHMWMDEGLTQYNGYQAERDFLKQENEQSGRDSYLALARTQGEVELMRHSDQVPPRTASRAHGVAAYDKPAALLMALRGMYGEEKFMRAYREYGRRWKYKHPTPYDFFNTFENVLGEDLDWFWTPWFFETWTMDQGIESVASLNGGTKITIFDKGLAPMPVVLEITRPDGKTERHGLSANVWLETQRPAFVTVPGSVTKVVIDPDDVMPDIDRSNNTWQR